MKKYPFGSLNRSKSNTIGALFFLIVLLFFTKQESSASYSYRTTFDFDQVQKAIQEEYQKDISPRIPPPQVHVTDPLSLLQGVFLGLMVVMTIYNLFLYFSLRDKAYLLYVGTAFFGILSALAMRGLSGRFFWPNYPDLDGIIYITWAGLSMFCSSRFAATFLNLKTRHKRLDRYMWGIAIMSLLMTVLSLFLTIEEITPFGRVLVLVAFPSYIVVGIIAYRKGYKPALFYVIAWVPYALGLVIRTLHGAGLLPDHPLIVSSIQLGGALEIVLLSFALADRIKGMRKELAEKELEQEQFKTKLLEEQKEILERTVDERTRELREANAAKDKFFSIIAHDLRSPMIGLQGVGQKLEYFIKKDRQEKLLQVGAQIDQSIDQLNHLLNNLLNWASSQVGGVPHHPDRTNLEDLVSENVKLYNSLAESKEVTVINQIVDLTAYVDANAISTVIRNLLSNAIKFSPIGGEILISSKTRDGFSMIIISDQGQGMDEEKRSSLFSVPLKSSRGTGSEKGFGLGLKLCKEFVERNQGRIEVESILGKGSSFTVYLPEKAQSIERSLDAA